MNTCLNCMYWGNSYQIQKGKANQCGMIELDEPNSKDAAFIDVQVADDTSLRASLMTVSDFSCSLHKPKPQTNEIP